MYQQLSKSLEEISQMIKETPCAGRKEVEEYHSKIINILDSGNIVEVPSIEHRNLHQQIWIAGFMVHNGCKDFNDAFLRFNKEEIQNGKDREFKTQRTRFDIWYDKKYIDSYIEQNSRRYNWAVQVQKQAEEEASKIVEKPLSELIVEICGE
ncbi:MAG: hypothetical protein WC781_02530 [Candidatus Pacearchaeota archaeon]|jgi:hypothetical protein